MFHLPKVSVLGVMALAGISTAAHAGESHPHHPAATHAAWTGWGGVYYPVLPYQGVYTVAVPGPVSTTAPQAYHTPPADPQWQRMMERCSTLRRADNGVGGALIGGALGGVIGNRVAEGDRALGTVAGAAIGAIAGAAIDRAEDKDRERALHEECDAWFAANPAPSGHAYPGGLYGYPGYMLVPVMLPAQQKPCVETTTTTEEWVPVRQRAVPRRPAARAIKRVKDKRVWTGS